MLLQKAVGAESLMLWGIWVGLWRRNPSRGVSLAWKKPKEGRSLGSSLGSILMCLAVMFLRLLDAVKAITGAGWTFGHTLHGFSCVFTLKVSYY